MKKALIILSLIVLIIGAKAQGNLEFNAVKRFSNNAVTVPTVSNVSAGSITVPANKVWKIESGSSSASSGNATTHCYLSIDGQLLFSYAGDGVFFSSPAIWLPAGTYDVSMYNNWTSSVTYKVKVSAIEFNIIP